MPDNRDMSNDGLNSPPDGVEGVELKVTLGGTQVDAGLREFRLDPSAAESREIFFCERADASGDPVVLPLLSAASSSGSARSRGAPATRP